MRRIVGLGLLGLGVFLIVLAPLARFYVYPQLAVVPVDQNTTSVLVGPDAQVFDISSLEVIDTDLETTAKTVGDIKASNEAPEDVAVWVNTSSTKDSGGTVRSRSVDRVAFDRTTGMAVNCCGEYYESVEGELQPVKHEGLVFKFPFDTEKKTYPWWDTTLLETVPIGYRRTEEIEGITTYVFSHTIEPTQYATAEVPASVLEVDQDGNVEAERMYSNVRTLWVEPETGVVVKRSEEQYNTLRYDGEDRLITTAVTTVFDDATVKDYVDEYGPKAMQLNLVRNLLPLGALIVGVLLIIVGIALSRRPTGARVR